MDTARIKQLIARREEIDQEPIELVTGAERKSVKCSKCGVEGHKARTCARSVTPPPDSVTPLRKGERSAVSSVIASGTEPETLPVEPHRQGMI